MILDQFNLKAEVALVTCSPRGLGAGIALATAEAGSNLAAHVSSRMPEDTLVQLALMGVPRIGLVGECATRYLEFSFCASNA